MVIDFTEVTFVGHFLFKLRSTLGGSRSAKDDQFDLQSPKMIEL